jgi:hypothetical protein
MEVRSLRRVLSAMKVELDEKKKLVETLKNAQSQFIPAQFLASEKLAMNKRRYSPKKNMNLVMKTARTQSASK